MRFIEIILIVIGFFKFLISRATSLFPFFFRTDSKDSPDFLPTLLSIRFYIFVSLSLHFSVFLVSFGRLSRLMSAFEHTLKYHLVSYRIKVYNAVNENVTATWRDE